MSTSSLYGCLLLLVFFISKLLLSTNSLKTPRKLYKAPLIGPPLIRPKTKSQGSLKDLLQNLSEPEQFSDINAIMSLNKELNKYNHKKITVNSALIEYCEYMASLIILQITSDCFLMGGGRELFPYGGDHSRFLLLLLRCQDLTTDDELIEIEIIMVICCDIIDQQKCVKPYSYSGLLPLQTSDTPGATMKSEAQF